MKSYYTNLMKGLYKEERIAMTEVCVHEERDFSYGKHFAYVQAIEYAKEMGRDYFGYLGLLERMLHIFNRFERSDKNKGVISGTRRAILIAYNAHRESQS